MTDQVQMLDEEPEAREDRVVSAALAEFDPLQANLEKLRQRYEGVAYDLTTTKGDREARTARKELVALRGNVKTAYAAWNQPVLAAQRKMRERAADLTAAIEAVENPINEQIVADEARREQERQAKAAIEAEKRAVIQTAINRITGFAMDAVGESSAVINALGKELHDMEISLEVFGDRTGEAEQARQKVLAQLNSLYASTKAHEDQQAELTRQRAELAAQQEQARKEAEAAERQRAAREAEERVAREQQEARDRAAAQKREQEVAAERAEQARIAKAESDRIAAEQKARADELAAREAVIAQRERAAKAAEEQAARAAEAERAQKQRIADDAAAAERKRLDDIAAAERAEKDRKQAEAMQAAQAERDAEDAYIARLNAAAKPMHAALTVMVHKARKQNWQDNYPEELAQAVAALALVDGEEA